MEIKRNGSQPSGKGPTDWFTGTVRIDPLFQAPDPVRVGGASVEVFDLYTEGDDCRTKPANGIVQKTDYLLTLNYKT